MKKKLMFLVPIVLFFMAGFFNSCNAPQRDDDEAEIEVEIEEGVDEFRNDMFFLRSGTVINRDPVSVILEI